MTLKNAKPTYLTVGRSCLCETGLGRETFPMHLNKISN